MKIYNNNPAFGDCGPFESDAPTFRLACFELANEMKSCFKTWLDEQEDAHHDALNHGEPSELAARDVRMATMRREFMKGLTEIRRCEECGQDYHVDATERGHKNDCSKRFEKVTP